MSTSPRSSAVHSASPLVSRPQRRRALGDDAEPLEILVGEEQVVRTGLDRHIDAAGPRLGGHAPRRVPC